MRTRPRTVAAVAAALLFPSLAITLALAQPAPTNGAPTEAQDLANVLLARAEQHRTSNNLEAAALRALVAVTLDPDNANARTALARAAGALAQTPPEAPPDELDGAGPGLPVDIELRHRIADERQRREELSMEVDRLARLVNQQNDQINRLQSSLSDRGRAEPITSRLERDLQDTRRELDRVRSDMSRLERELSRLQSRPR